jgi:hypothetical protein
VLVNRYDVISIRQDDRWISVDIYQLWRVVDVSWGKTTFCIFFRFIYDGLIISCAKFYSFFSSFRRRLLYVWIKTCDQSLARLTSNHTFLLFLCINARRTNVCLFSSLVFAPHAYCLHLVYFFFFWWCIIKVIASVVTFFLFFLKHSMSNGEPCQLIVSKKH